MGDNVFHAPVGAVIQAENVQVTVYPNGISNCDPREPEEIANDKLDYNADSQITALYTKWGLYRTFFRMTVSRIKYGPALITTSAVGLVLALLDIYVLHSMFLQVIGTVMAAFPIAYLTQKINRIYGHLKKSYGLRWCQSKPLMLIRWSEFSAELRCVVPNYQVVVKDLLIEFDKKNRLGSAPAAKGWLVGMLVITMISLVLWFSAILLNQKHEIFGVALVVFTAVSAAIGISYIGDLHKIRKQKELVHWLEWILEDDKKANSKRS